MGGISYRRHRLQSRAEGIVEGLQGPLFQVEVSQIIIHEGDEPNAVLDLFDSKGLAGKDGWEVDFLAVQANATAGGDEDVLVVEWVADFRQSLIGPG